MTTLTPAPTAVETELSDRRTLVIAWIATLALSALPEVVLIEWLGMGDPPGGWIRLAVAVALVASAPFWPAGHALRGYFAVMLAVILVDDVLIGLLGGLVTVEGPHPIVNLVVTYTAPFFVLAVAFAGFMVLGLRLTRQEAYLTVGDLRARSGLRLPGMRRPPSWILVGSALAVFFAGAIAAALASEGAYADATVERLLPLVPLVLASAFFNAFGEEVVFRAGPLATLSRVVGAGQAVLLTSVWFGLAHWLGGIPSGLSGAIGSGVLGLALGWAMVRTRGLGWPLIIHIAVDTPIMLAIAAS
jgi:membrane protease YdiL (CAAX protease family)